MTTSSFVPGQVLSEGGGGGVAEGEPLAVGGDPVAIGDAGAGGGAVPGEADVGVLAHLREVGQRAVVGAVSTRQSASFSCLVASVAQPWPKLSQTSMSTGRAPSIDHIAISKAPVSEAGTMPTR